MSQNFLEKLTSVFGGSKAQWNETTVAEFKWKVTDNDTTLIIRGNGEMPTYKVFFAPWSKYKATVNTIIIENGVKSIGKQVFTHFTNLTSITIPNSVTSIEDWAFDNCKNLTSITIPNSVKSIGIGAFRGCENLFSVNIPDGVTNIGESAFDGCKNLTSIIIPNSITNIEDSVFYECNNLISIIIPNSVESIGKQAFYACENLTSIIIPRNVTSIGQEVCLCCYELTSVNVESENINYVSENGVLFDKSKTTLICYPAGKAESEYVIPNSVTHIEDSAFFNCDYFDSVTLPTTLTNIGENAFWGCLNLISITNLNPVPITIKPDAFRDIPLEECTLKVPMASVAAYKNAEVWKEFNIVGTEEDNE